MKWSESFFDADYGSLIRKGTTGLGEEFQFSTPERLTRFASAWEAFDASFE
jgi:hypothetical protein